MLAAKFRNQAERDEFVFVAQAVLSLRLRGNDENRFLVRDELSAEGAPLEIRSQRLDAIFRIDFRIREHHVC